MEFTATVKIKDIYGGKDWTTEKIAAVLKDNLESDADVEVLEIKDIAMGKPIELRDLREKS